MAEHGTKSGYQQHYRAGEKPCEACVIGRRAEAKAYYEKNKSRVLEHTRNWEANNRDKVNAAKREAYAANPEKERQRVKEYREANLEKVRAYYRKYQQENPDKVRRVGSRRRARLRGNLAEIYTTEQVLNEYGTDCHICKEPIDLSAPRQVGQPGWEAGLHIDHLIEICNGGPDTLENVRPAHARCNLTRSRNNGREKRKV